ncbi:N-acetyltransferase [Candidatus Bathyarchaeota archaeon]|nr:N-acetyltransferase [Candidatus Bathyarchaeota archaeon]
MGSFVTKIYVDSTAIIDKESKIGKGTKIWHFVHIMENSKIGIECVISDYVYVGKGVTIGNNVKLENRVTIYEGVTIEDDVFVGPHVTFTNDLNPRSFANHWKKRYTYVKKGSSIGAGTVIICGITINEYALVGAGSVVTENVPAHALVYGNPAKIRGFVCRCGIKLETNEKLKKHVFMVCPICNEKYKIAFEDYSKIKKE